MNAKDYENFKKVLEFFVVYLNFANKDFDEKERMNITGFDEYITDCKSLPKRGLGYRGDKIQEYINNWDIIAGNKVTINVNSSFGSYATQSSYLYFQDTNPWVNIFAVFENKEVVALEACLKKEKQIIKGLICSTISDLGLFDKDVPNSHIKEFVDKCIEEIKKQIFDLEEKKQSLLENKNVVFTGAPGTGKTFLAKEIAKQIVGKENSKTNIDFVQFHQSYDYTDFVEGLRPTNPDKNGNITFKMVDGVFKQFCARALDALIKTPDGNDVPKYVFIIDEINRGEPSKIFGELFYSLDPGYRVGKKDLAGELSAIRTQYANVCDAPNPFDSALGHNDVKQYGHFFVPDNVFVIGTMNDIDRSVESIDFAFRRRFTWIEIKASEQIEMLNALGKVKEEAIDRMTSLNNAIFNEKNKTGIEGLSSSYHIGAAYFLNLKKYIGDENDQTEIDAAFKKLWQYHLNPLLREYLRGMDDADGKLEALRKAFFHTDTASSESSGNQAEN